MKKYRVYYKVLHPKDIYNLADLRFVWRASTVIGDSWWDKKHDKFREEIADYYFKRMDKLTNHYTSLRKSVEEKGFLNPVPITRGPPKFKNDFLPPEYFKLKPEYVLEYMGCSRYMLAKENDLTLPCIISDFSNDTSQEELLKTKKDILNKFHDKTVSVNFTDKGLRFRMKNYDHIKDKNYNQNKQSRARGIVIAEIEQLTKDYLKS